MSNNVLGVHYVKSDKMMLIINVLLFVYSLGLASWYGTWAESILVGGGTLIAVFAIYKLMPGSMLSRIAFGASLMVFTGLHIHQAHGMLEMHFGVFALLAMLLYYRDWVPLVAGAGTIAVHHLGFFFLQASGASVWVLTSTESGIWIIFIHAGYVVAETALLVWFAIDLKKEAIESLEIKGLTDSILEDEKINLTLRSTGKTELLKRFDQYTNDVETMVKKIIKSSGVLNTEGHGLVKLTQEMSSNSNIQAQETDSIAQAVEQMHASITDVSQSANNTAEISSEVDATATKATSESQKTQKGVIQLADKVSEAAKAIAELNEQANGIGSVLDVIRGVAEQTNLLALNAAIEAARAGDQGRGFAVVADEVRTLAQRTQQSTEEIDQMIGKLQSGSHSTVNLIEASQTQVQECVENTKMSLTLMEEVSQSLGEISEKNTIIANSSNEQMQVISDVTKNLTNIRDSAESTNEDCTLAVQFSDSLLVMSQELSEISQSFKVSE